MMYKVQRKERIVFVGYTPDPVNPQPVHVFSAWSDYVSNNGSASVGTLWFEEKDDARAFAEYKHGFEKNGPSIRLVTNHGGIIPVFEGPDSNEGSDNE